MSIKEKVLYEISNFTCDSKFRIATIGTTARESQPFAVLPRRTALGFEVINFLVTDPKHAEECLNILDGEVKYILIDVEFKKDIDLMSIAKRVVKGASLVSYKPNDTTLEATDLFVRNYFQDNLQDKKVLVYGAGNLGSKLSLRLAERGCQVFLDSRDKEKTREIVRVLNHLAPKYSLNSIEVVQDYSKFINELDALIAFTSASGVISHTFAQFIKRQGLALDGGINNFTPKFIMDANRVGVNCFRLDVRAAFPYALLSLSEYTSNFYQNIQGEVTFGETRLVAGGIIGSEGDVVVDSIKEPRQIIGIANGIGGIKHENEYTDRERKTIQQIRDAIFQSL